MSFGAFLAADRALAASRGHALPEAALGAALFADISGFTPLAEALARDLGPRAGAEVLASYLNVIYEALIGAIHRHGGAVVSFSGDAVTCWFEQPLPEAARNALHCAFALQAAMRSLASLRTPAGAEFALALKVAVAAGPARRLLVGDPAIQRTDVLVGATLLRLAAAEHCAGAGEVVADEATLDLAGDAVSVVEWRSGENTASAVVLSMFELWQEEEPEQREWHAPAIVLDQVRAMLPPAIAERLARGYGEPPTELRPAVALFVRFATLDYDADPAAGALLDAYVRWAQGVVARYGGTLLQVTVGDKGSYVYAAFGAPAAHENDPERAARAARELQTPPLELAWAGAPQIGIARGTMRTGTYGGSARRTYGVLGDAVNVAARLMQAAAPGQILASAMVQQACVDLFAWEALPPLPLKGKREPLATFQLVGARDERAEAFYRGALVGREEQVAQLLAAAQPVLAGRFAGACYVQGEAGIGKSRLVYEARRRLAEQTALASMYCPSDEVLRGSLHPFAAFLREYCGQSAALDDAANKERFAAAIETLLAALEGNEQARLLADELRRTGPFLGALLGLRWEGSLYERLDPRLRFENTLAALVALIKVESLRRPVWLELEDAHWLDDASRALVAQLSMSLVGFPVFIVCAARPDDEGRPFALALADDAPAHTIDLQTLPPESAGALVAEVLNAPPDAGLARFVYERTGGNPFFAEQLLLDLRERQLIGREARGGAWALLAPAAPLAEVPDTLASLLVARIDRLAEPVRDVVLTASVLGRTWALPVLAAMRGDDNGLPPLVRSAEDGRVWSPLSEHDYLFRHVLLRDAAYDMQASERRRGLHRRAIAAIEGEHAENLAPQFPALAYHCREAEDRERERRYARLAGEAAAVRYANAEAVAFLSRALELTPEEALAERWELLLAREKVHNLGGETIAQEADLATVMAIAEALNDDELRARVLLRQANLMLVSGDNVNAINAARKATILSQGIGFAEGVAEAQYLWGSSLGSLSRKAEALDQLQIALRVAQQHGFRAIEIEVNRLLGRLYATSDIPKARRYFDQALEAAQQSNDLLTHSRILASLALTHAIENNYAVARDYCERSLELATEAGDRRQTSGILSNLGRLSFLQGHYAASQHYYEQCLSLCLEIGSSLVGSDAVRALGEIAIACGNYAQARTYFATAFFPDGEDESINNAKLGLISCRLGDYSQAIRLLEQSLTNARGDDNTEAESMALHTLGGVALQLGTIEQSLAYFDQSLTLRQNGESQSYILQSTAGLALAALAQGQATQAAAYIQPILEALSGGNTFAELEEPLFIPFVAYQALHAVGDARAAAVLEAAYTTLRARADLLPDETARRMFLEAVPYHSEIVKAWEART